MLCPNKSKGQSAFDSLKIKEPKHYFNTVIVAEGYRKPNKALEDTTDAVSKRLKSYGIKQFNLYFHAPLFTRNIKGSDTSVIKNSHLLLTGNFVSLRPVFDGLNQHNLIKLGLGLRYIYNAGKKGVWFVEVSPFVTFDASYESKPYYRIASTLIYSHNVSESFNWRLGATKSFLWGNRYYLPFVGFRFGRLDKIHLSVQFPRRLNLNIPVSSKVLFSLYVRPQGGMFNFSNTDSLYLKNPESTFHFTRFEMNSGFRFDFRFNSHFNCYVASGFSTRNSITFYSDKANSGRQASSYNTYFYSKKLDAGLFFNFGLVLVFGKTKSYYYNTNIYDAIDLGNTMDPNGNGNAQIPLTPKKKVSEKNLSSISDLIDYNDF
jgi:hypothetical protein